MRHPIKNKHETILQYYLRERQRGVENSGGWKTYRKFGVEPLPKNVFGSPHLPYVSPPPPFCRLSVISLTRKRHRTDQPQFLRPPKVFLESTLCSTFSPLQIHVIRFAPPSAAAQLSLQVSRDMKSIVAGPLRSRCFCRMIGMSGRGGQKVETLSGKIDGRLLRQVRQFSFVGCARTGSYSAKGCVSAF